MDEEKVINAITKALEEKLPDVANGIVETAVKEKFAEVTEAIKEMNENIKLGNVAKEDIQKKEEAKEVMANYFKLQAKGMTNEANDVLKEYSKKAEMNEGTDSAGGYLVPREFSREVFYVAGEFGLARKLSTIIPMVGDKKDIPNMTNSIIAYWTDEGIIYTGSKPTFGNIELIAYKATALASATLELIDDNQTNTEIRALTSRAIAEKIAEFEDTNVFITSTKFTGLLDDGDINELVMGSGATSIADITFDDIIQLKRAVPLRYKKNGKACYFMSEDAIKYIELLKSTDGQYLYYPSRNINDDQVMNGPVGRMNGSPVYLSEVFPGDSDDVADLSFILFGDMKYRAFGDRKTLQLTFGYLSTNWEKDIQSLKATERIAGKKMDANAFAKLTTAST